MKKNPSAFYVRAPDVAPREATAAETSGLPADRMGVPIFWYWRAMLEPRRYSHPGLGELKFSQGELSEADRWTNEMIADGSKPYLPVGHKGKDANQGFIWRTKYDGQYLHGLHGFIGESARERAAQNETSVCLRRNWKGGNGKVYPLVVEHNALVPDAVAMGLPDYVALSRDASGLPDEVLPVFSPAAERNPDMTPEQVLMAREILGETEEPVTEENALDMIFSMARTARALNDQVDEAAVEMSRSADEVTDLRAMLDEAKGQVTTLSRTAPQMVDPEALADRADAYMSRVELAAEKGDLPKFIADRLKGVVLPKGKPSVFMLSRSEDFDARPIDAVLDLFKDSQLGKKIAPGTGEVTGAQLIEFARTEPGTGEPAKPASVNPYQATIDAQTKGKPAA